MVDSSSIDTGTLVAEAPLISSEVFQLLYRSLSNYDKLRTWLVPLHSEIRKSRILLYRSLANVEHFRFLRSTPAGVQRVATLWLALSVLMPKVSKSVPAKGIASSSESRDIAAPPGCLHDMGLQV